MSESQQNLLAVLDRVQAIPRTASGDPVSSERAEIRMRESGQMRSQALEVLELVKQFPGRTSKQLGELGSLDRYRIARRLPELLAARKLTRTDEDRESRWWPV
jgi:hypothetical protein